MKNTNKTRKYKLVIYPGGDKNKEIVGHIELTPSDAEMLNEAYKDQDLNYRIKE